MPSLSVIGSNLQVHSECQEQKQLNPAITPGLDRPSLVTIGAMRLIRKRCSLRLRHWLVLPFAICLTNVAAASVRAVVDQVVYEVNSPKLALVIGSNTDASPTTFTLIDVTAGKPVLDGTLQPAGEVYAWKGINFWIADFSACNWSHACLRSSD